MSIQSELYYLLQKYPLADGEELKTVLAGDLDVGQSMSWEGIIAITNLRLFFSSEPGLVSNGCVYFGDWASVNWIKLEDDTISAQFQLSKKRRQTISICLHGFEDDTDIQTMAQELVAFVRSCRANSVSVALQKEFQRALDCDEAEQALPILESIAAKDRISAVPHAVMAIYLARLGRFGEAISAIEQAMSRGLAQTAIAAWVHCRAHMANGEEPEAEREANRILAEVEQGEPMFGILSQILSQSDLHGDALEAILVCQFSQNKWSLALQTSEALERVLPDDPRVHYYRCRIALEMGDLKLAKSSLAKYRRSDHHDETEAMFLDAQIKWANKKRDAAIRLATDALKRAPEDIIIIGTLLDWLSEAKQWHDVVRIADQALAVLGQPNGYALMRKASALSKLKEHQEALRCADEALRVAGPSDWLINVVCRLIRANALSGLGRHKDALVAVDETREFSKQHLNGDFLQQWKRLWGYMLDYVQARALCGLKRYQEALPLLRQASRLPPEEEDILREIEKLQEEARIHLESVEESSEPERSEEADEQRGPSISGKRDETLRRLISLQQKLEKDRRLAELAEEVRRMRDYYERPLTLAILG